MSTCIANAPFLIAIIAVFCLIVIPVILWGCWKYRKHIHKKMKAARSRLGERKEFFNNMNGIGSRWGKDANKHASTERSSVGYTAQIDDGDRSQVGRQRGLMDRLSSSFKA